jgi:hypothetical protein
MPTAIPVITSTSYAYGRRTECGLLAQQVEDNILAGNLDDARHFMCDLVAIAKPARLNWRVRQMRSRLLRYSDHSNITSQLDEVLEGLL